MNTWLISNSQLYFSSKILTGELPLNVYSLLDLSNLLESILLADEIEVLPGRGLENDITDKLKSIHLLKELDIKRDIAETINQLKFEWDTDSVINKNQEVFSRILCDIFPIEKDIAEKAISNANLYWDQTYNTPNWEITKVLNLETILREDYAMDMVRNKVED
jgi:hypothetical protein